MTLYAIDNQAPARTESHDQLRSYVDRFKTLLEDQNEIKDAVADLKKEAKGNGFDPKHLVRLAREALEPESVRAKRIADEEELDRLRHELGMFTNTPLGRATIQRATTHVGAMAD